VLPGQRPALDNITHPTGPLPLVRGGAPPSESSQLRPSDSDTSDSRARAAPISQPSSTDHAARNRHIRARSNSANSVGRDCFALNRAGGETLHATGQLPVLVAIGKALRAAKRKKKSEVTLTIKPRNLNRRRKRIVAPEPPRRLSDCRCGKKMTNTTTAEDLAKSPDRTWLECDSCGMRAYRDKGKRTQWVPAFDVSRQASESRDNRTPEKSRSTDYRLKPPRPGGPHSHRTY
jgi:hypothetical protein